MQVGTRTPALVAMTAMSLLRHVGPPLRAGAGGERPAGDRGLARRRLRPAGAADARDHRDRPAGGARRAAHLPRPVYQLAAAPAARAGPCARARARCRPFPSTSPPLSPRAWSSPARSRTAGSARPSCPSTRACSSSPSARARARAGRTLADLDLQAGGTVAFGDDVERLIAERRPGLAFTLGAMGSARHNFYNDAFRARGLRGRRRRGAAALAGRRPQRGDRARARRARAQDQSARHGGHGAGQAGRLSRAPASPRCASSPPGRPWTSVWPPSPASSRSRAPEPARPLAR